MHGVYGVHNGRHNVRVRVRVRKGAACSALGRFQVKTGPGNMTERMPPPGYESPDSQAAVRKGQRDLVSVPPLGAPLQPE